MSKKYWIPHALTVSRMAAALFLGQQIVFAETAAGHLPMILALTGYIFLSDLLDGHLARKWTCCSPIGAKLDIAADLLYIVSQDLILIRRGWMPSWVLLLVFAEFLVFSMTAKSYSEQDDRTVIRFDRVGRAAAVHYYLMPLLYLLLSEWDTGTWALRLADLLCLSLTLAAVMSRFHVWNESRGVGQGSPTDGQYRKGFVE